MIDVDTVRCEEEGVSYVAVEHENGVIVSVFHDGEDNVAIRFKLTIEQWNEFVYRAKHDAMKPME